MDREFVETGIFSADWNSLGQTDDQLRVLQNYLARHPEAGPIVEGAGGIRKIRWKREGRSGGKSGGLRVIYWDNEKRSSRLCRRLS